VEHNSRTLFEQEREAKSRKNKKKGEQDLASFPRPHPSSGRFGILFHHQDVNFGWQDI